MRRRRDQKYSRECSRPALRSRRRPLHPRATAGPHAVDEGEDGDTTVGVLDLETDELPATDLAVSRTVVVEAGGENPYGRYVTILLPRER